MIFYFHFCPCPESIRDAQKWEVFAQFWEPVGSKTSHMLIEYQSVSLKVRRNKNLRKKNPAPVKVRD